MLMVPIVLFVDGTSLIARLESGVGQFSAPWFGKTALAGVCRAVDVLASYALLARVNPFTHSLSNCARVRASAHKRCSRIQNTTVLARDCFR